MDGTGQVMFARRKVFMRSAFVALAVAALATVYALLPQVPGTAALHHAEQLRASQMRLELALLGLKSAQPQAAQAVLGAVQVHDHQLVALRSDLNEAHLQVPELVSLERAWAELRTALARHVDVDAAIVAVRAQAPLSEALAAAVLKRTEQRFNELMWGFRLMLGVLVLSLLLPLIGLWRQRQQLKSSLHQFSDHLGQGDWHDAVQHLR